MASREYTTGQQANAGGIPITEYGMSRPMYQMYY